MSDQYLDAIGDLIEAIERAEMQATLAGEHGVAPVKIYMEFANAIHMELRKQTLKLGMGTL